MLKDYYYSSIVDGISSIEPYTIDAIDHILLRQACFSTYGRCRGYMKRVQSCGKVFLWKGLYYEVSEECKNFILSLLKLNSAPCSIDYDRLSLLMRCKNRQSLDDDLRFKAFIDYTSNELARDGVKIPENLFDEVKK